MRAVGAVRFGTGGGAALNYAPMDGGNDGFTDAQAEAWVALVRYCAGRERSAFELQRKLDRLGLPPARRPAVLERLRAEGFHDEARYARAFATDRQRLQGWGALRIRQGLRRQRVPEPLIDQALAALDGTVFDETLERLLARKLATLREEEPARRRARLLRYGMGRGFSPEAVYRAVDALLKR